MSKNMTSGCLLYLISAVLLASCSKPGFDKIDQVQNKYDLSTEPELSDEGHVGAINALFDTGMEGDFYGADSIRIHYTFFVQPGSEKGAIVISAGRTEAAVKYKEVIYDLYRNGYSVYIHDHRGQGLSGRMLADPEMGYIDDFQFYVDDFKQFYDDFVRPRDHGHLFLLAHSMGGAIAATYLEQNPDDFEAAAFTSPMLGLTFPSCPVATLLSTDKPRYAPGNSTYEKELVAFEKNKLTGSRIRYERMAEVFEQYPGAKLGGATYRWAHRSCSQFKVIFDNISEISIPLILFSGSNEQIVDPKAHNNFVYQLDASGIDATGLLVEDSKHEMLFETDEIRIEVLTRILDFYARFE